MSQLPIYILEFDLLCKKPQQVVPTYRIYVDNDLLVERYYLWDNQKEFVRERCELRLTSGEHIVEIVNVEKEQGVGYTIKNAALNNVPIDINLDGIFKIEQ